MANARQEEIDEIRMHLEELSAALDEVAWQLQGPCPICGRECDPSGRMCHRGRQYFYGEGW